MFNESEFVELKRTVSKSLLKTVVAFANSKGGTIYIGIEDDGTVCGVEDADATMLAAMDSIRHGIKPNASVVSSCEALEHNGHTIVGIKVERGAKQPYYLAAKGMRPEGVYVRQGAASYMATESEILEMLKRSEGLSFEDGRSLLQDLTFEYASEVFANHGLEFSDAQMHSLGLVDADGLYTNLGLWLSDQCPSSMKLAAFYGVKRLKFRDRLETEGSLLKQVDETLGFIAKYNEYLTKFVDMRRVDYENFPPDAVREALFNAIVHRDYSLPSANLISVLEDRVEIVSHGGLPNGESLEDFQMDVSVLRNPKLAAIFYRLGFIEAYGTGIIRMFEAYESDVVAPEFQITKHIFKVTLPNRNVEFEPRGSTAVDQSNTNDTATSALLDQEQLVLSVVTTEGPLKRAEIQERTEFSQATLLRTLKRLIDKGLVKAKGNTRNRVYVARSRLQA